MPQPLQLAVLALVWALWCLSHSLWPRPALRGRLRRALGLASAQYRLAYSAFSLVTIAPAAWLSWRLGDGTSLFHPWPWLGLQLMAWLLAGVLFFWAERSFSSGGLDLLGLSDSLRGIDRPPVLVTRGAYAHTRHPMNWATLLLIWTRPLSPAAWVVNLVLTVYLVAATFHEEARLAGQFGDEWRAYARAVPRFFWRLSYGGGPG